MTYSLSPREIVRAKPEGFPESSGYISSYIPTQTFSIKTPAFSFLNINIGRVDSALCIAPKADQYGKIMPSRLFI